VAVAELVPQENHAAGSKNCLTPCFGGLHHGCSIALMREIPFAVIQFPLCERSQKEWGKHKDRLVSPAQAAAWGSFASEIAAGAMTHLDPCHQDKIHVGCRSGWKALQQCCQIPLLSMLMLDDQRDLLSC